MKGSDVFTGKSLKAEDIKGYEPVVTIEKVTTQDFDDGKKPIIHFVGKEKTLVCNRTNWNSIVDITGREDSDDWGGCKIKLVVARVDYQGKRVDAIRIDPPGNGHASRPPQPPPPPQRHEPVDAPNDDDIPF
jgi:hypothetical protein